VESAPTRPGRLRRSETPELVERGEPNQLFGAVEGEDLPAAGARLQGVGELGDGAGGLVSEGQRQAEMGQAVGEALQVLPRLGFDAGEGVALGLGLDDAHGLAVGVQEVVGLPALEGKFTDGDAQASRDVHVSVALYDPAALL
jgi:hypothetical protein